MTTGGQARAQVGPLGRAAQYLPRKGTGLLGAGLGQGKISLSLEHLMEPESKEMLTE